MIDQINKNNAIYYASVKAYPNDYRGVKWTSAESQFIRFKILCEMAEDIFKSSLLDVGCGLGHLVDYLISNSFQGTYKGIDIVDQMIRGAKKRHPNYVFETNDIDSVPINSHDYVLASGIFAFSDWHNMQKDIKKLFTCGTKGLAFNGLSISTTSKESELFYVDPSQIFNFCKTITPYVTLKQRYLPGDFTIYMFNE